MEEKYLNKLEYNKILEILSTFAITYLGKELCLNLKPFTSKEKVSLNLSKTSEALTLLFRKSTPPILEISDITKHLKLLISDIPINTKALLEVATIIKSARLLKEYFYNDENFDLSSFSNLEPLFSNLYINMSVEKRIFDSILDENTISDDASTNLKNIRRNQKNFEGSIKEKLNQILHSSTYSKYIMDPVVTIRNDRYVIPVKEEYRTQIKGFIHDMSASGSTVFIEPMSVFELNNKINNLKIEENIEIEKVLKDLSNLLIPFANEIENDLNIIGNIDFIFAKAKYSKKINGISPILNDKKFLYLEKARHPLIDSSKVVPITFELGKEYTSLIITGPNTGGKTVTLKTTGLLCLMAQSGLHVPANENSSIFVFDNIFADIGDEQSIQESLSTFSSHMLNVSSILNNSTKNSLVLLDELGSGTDPVEGSSLAISILNNFINRDILTISTTHYHEIKNYALVTKGFKNASVEFDVETLSPTYKLLIGVPGKSNAFEISKKLGISDDILNTAKAMVNKDVVNIEELLKKIYDDKLIIEKEKENILKNSNQVELLRKALQKDNTALKNKEKELIENAKYEAKNILLSAKEDANEIIKELNNLENDNSSNKKANILRNKLNDKIKNTSTTSNTNINTSILPDEIKLNMNVFINTINQSGIIISMPNKKNEVTVLIGNSKMNINIQNLSLLNIAKGDMKKMASSTSKNSTNLKSKNINSEINVIGFNVDEAIYVIDKYLDDAAISNLPSVRIVHGKGTGVLRAGIHKYLKTNPHVKTFRIRNFW